MISLLVSSEGLSAVVEPPPTMLGLVKLYPTATESELDDVAILRPLAEKLINMVREKKGGLFIVEVPQKEVIALLRKMGEVVPGLGGAPLYFLAVPSLKSSGDFGEAVGKLMKLGDEMEAGSVVYLEFPELIIPSDAFLTTANIPEELKMAIYMMRKEVVDSLKKAVDRGSLILITTLSATYISEDVLDKANKVYRLTTSGVQDITDAVKQQ